MATEQLPVNGTFVPAQAQAYTAEQPVANHAASDSISASHDIGTAATGDIPKDEVGWYFVEQYYTTLSKSPEKLFLFYNKRSQFVSGSETEKVNVCVGQKAIDERIKALDIQDCKVRVTNVDSQGSGQNIVIQVIGEMSNKTTPRTKFTQTFVLAEQTNGYFVLNDIFRYMVDDEDEVDGAAAPAAQDTQVRDEASPEPHTLTNSQNPDERERDAQLVDEGLKEAISQPNGAVEPPTVAVNGAVPVEVAVAADEAPVAATANHEDAPAHVESVATVVQTEKPPAPQSTPAPAASPSPAAAQPSAGPKPIIPKTWANLVAAGGNKPSAAAAAAAAQSSQSAPTPAAAAAPSQPKAAPAAQAAASAQPITAATAGQEIEHPDTPQSSGSEWQTAQQHHGKKQQRPQSIAGPIANTRAYMKNVNENVTEEALHAALSKHGELTYLDISRPRNSAFADFATPQDYQAAVAANPHEVNGERIYVEERRVRPQSGHFGPGFQGGRGGMPARGGRGNADRPAGNQGRGGFVGNRDGQRGNFAGRGRAGGPRGRGVSQTA